MTDGVAGVPIPEELRRRYLDEGYWEDSSLGSMLATYLRARPDQTVRVWSKTSPRVTTFGGLDDLSRRFAAGLRTLGVRAGDRVVYQLPNGVEAAATFLGLAALGAVLVPVAGFYGRKELIDIVNTVHASVLVTTARHGSRNYLDELRDSRSAMPGLTTVVLCGSPPVPDAIAFEELCTAAPLPTITGVEPDGPCLFAFTSGTSGRSKAVLHTHRTLGAEVRLHLAAIVPRGMTPQIMASPIAHAAGMTMGLLGPLLRGEPINYVDAFDIDFILDVCARQRLAPGGGAVVFLSALIDHPGFTDEIAKRMGYVVLGGSIVPEVLVDKAARRGITVLRSYGSTEHPTISSGLITDSAEQLRRTDGRVLPGVEVVIRRPDGSPAPTGVEGEIYSRGPDRCVGYLDARENDGTFDADGWLATGDLGILDSAGHLAITGRTKDLIIRNGYNVSPAEVENALLTCEGVGEVAVVGVPDANTGERAVAFVVPRGSGTPALADLTAHLAAIGLAKPKWPEELRIVDAFPRTASGKVQKYVLRERRR
ncbi:long-chain-fatty-acid--CoA ligase [Mycolicibacterium madagascariense]|uniref:Long-chain-fatty-acid--CoA ligase n=1 Tax=Mycolicibacterium madagascariense TaxID=212765 RepID=A0A7I7XC17_9MYCO|nr:AMP-binding protein [Mycolicibacterium madagascariense]MCV7011677.1 AMP-binding protein [Mycolicibacterium madagascariense]BBZ27309.1 long-chain-fatty-acid--CoA ligase [Mycolicibacterium madagascariense]